MKAEARATRAEGVIRRLGLPTSIEWAFLMKKLPEGIVFAVERAISDARGGVRNRFARLAESAPIPEEGGSPLAWTWGEETVRWYFPVLTAKYRILTIRRLPYWAIAGIAVRAFPLAVSEWQELADDAGPAIILSLSPSERELFGVEELPVDDMGAEELVVEDPRVLAVHKKLLTLSGMELNLLFGCRYARR